MHLQPMEAARLAVDHRALDAVPVAQHGPGIPRPALAQRRADPGRGYRLGPGGEIHQLDHGDLEPQFGAQILQRPRRPGPALAEAEVGAHHRPRQAQSSIGGSRANGAEPSRSGSIASACARAQVRQPT